MGLKQRSNRQKLTLRGFSGLFTSLDGTTPTGFASDLLNVRMSDGKIRPRWGYKRICSRPSGFERVLGLIYLSGYDDSYANRQEFLSIEKRSGTVHPYSIDPITGARNQIGTVTLENVPHTGFSFGGQGYIVAPGGTKSLYRHAIGDLSSWTTLQDTAYVPPTKDAELTIAANSPASYAWNLSGSTPDSISHALIGPYGLVAIAGSTSTSGVIEVSGNNFNRGGQHRTRITASMGTNQDWTTHDYAVIHVTAGAGYPSFERTSIAARIQTNGSFKAVPYQEYFSPNQTQVAIVLRLKGIADLDKVQKLEFVIGGSVEDPLSPTVVVFNLQKVILGGTYLEASAAAKRLWDGNLDGDGITYGVRYKNGSTYSTLKTQQITAVQSTGAVNPAFACSIGGRITLSTPASGSSEPHVEFLRLAQDGTTWRVLGTVANSGSPQWQDRVEENELSSLAIAASTGSVTIPATPTFVTTGLTGGFAYKGWAIWLFRGGKSNVRHSRVGSAEELFSTEAIYETTDETQPADFTLADNFGDEPVGGVQAGEAAILLGRKAVYSQSGNAPKLMSPCRQVPGSSGVAGIYAFARYRPGDGSYGCAYVDPVGNVWFVSQQAAFAGDTQSRPFELSSSVRGYLWSYLVVGQQAEFGYSDLSGVQVQVDEATGSLWVVLGRRALVYRPADPITGRSFWEAYEYAVQSPALSASTSTSTVPSVGVSPATSVVRTGSTDAWIHPEAVFLSDAATANCTLSVGEKSELLRVASLPPTPSLPIDTTLNVVRVEVNHEKSGEAWAELDEAFFTVAGTRVGSNLATSGDVPSVLTSAAFEKTSAFGGITVAALNSGSVGFEVGYLTDPASAAKYDSANWTVSAVPTGPTSQKSYPSASISPIYTITATYIGSGSPPKAVVISMLGTVTASVEASNPAIPTSPDFEGTASAVAFSASDSGGIDSITSTSGVPELPTQREATATARVRIPMAGVTGTTTVTLTGTCSISRSAANHSAKVVSTLSDVEVVVPTPAVVSIDSVKLSVCYTSASTEPLVTTGVGIDRLAFSPFRRLYVLSSGGEVYALEWDPALNRPIDGVGRDGSLTMPLGYWTSGVLSGPRRRLIYARAAGSADCAAWGEISGWSNGTAGPAEGWTKFGLDSVGSQHRVRVSVSEATDSVDEVGLEFGVMSESKRI